MSALIVVPGISEALLEELVYFAYFSRCLHSIETQVPKGPLSFYSLAHGQEENPLIMLGLKR
jgi:hypothetical protein